tara:strand:- start:120 stop:380 length:261 start_codon:yes stop_codon:yes gene_type:complete
MRSNPFSSASDHGGRMTNPSDTNNPINQPFGFATVRRPTEPMPEVVAVPKDTVDSLKDLLQGMTETFREHGMFDLADEAEMVVELL